MNLYSIFWMKSSLALPSLLINKTARKLHCSEEGEVPVGLFDAAVEHLDEDVSVLGEFDHELLSLLHLFKAGLIDGVSVVKEEIVLTDQLYAHVLWSRARGLPVAAPRLQASVTSLESPPRSPPLAAPCSRPVSAARTAPPDRISSCTRPLPIHSPFPTQTRVHLLNRREVERVQNRHVFSFLRCPQWLHRSISN